MDAARPPHWPLERERPLLVHRTWRLPDGRIVGQHVVCQPAVALVVCLRHVLQQPEILMIREYRPIHDQVMWEVPGGDLQPGETPEAAALRELREESGYRGSSARLLFSCAASPGSSDEIYHYCAVDGLEPGEPAPMEDESIEVAWLPLAQAADMAARGEVRNAAAAIAILAAARLAGQ